MAQPQWITPAGDLGTIAEGLFFSTPVVAVDPDGGVVKYELIAGSLPEGIQVRTNGVIDGVPIAVARVQGVPAEVAENITSRFAIRAYVEIPGGRRISDRTFSLTVTGQDLPEFETPAGSIGTYFDGDLFEYQIEYSDRDPNDLIVVTLEDGRLPPGLTINRQGLIKGYFIPQIQEPGVVVTTNEYEFTLQISDGKDRVQRIFSISVISRDRCSADNTQLTGDSTVVTADCVNAHVPIITNYPEEGFIGTYRHSNFFAYQIIAVDFDGDTPQYILAPGDSSDLPGINLDINTGYLYGYIPDLGATENTYTFDVFVYKLQDPTMISPEPYTYTMNTIGDIETAVTWITPTNLGTIDNGAISTLGVEAVNASGRLLQYRLKPGDYPALPGVYNKLPQGLQLLPSGLISGQVSFNTFALDGGTTTFDVNPRTRLIVAPTTFDLKFNFTVEAYSIDGLVNVSKSFSITVNRKYNEPYESLYIQAMPSEEDRDLIDSLLQNQDIIQPSLLYRANDPYFGRASRIIYQHAFGLTASRIEDYVSALELNHYLKQLVLGELKVAQARVNNTGDILYEVVYSEIVDNGVNSQGESPPQSVPVAFPFADANDLSTEISEVYPNSLIQMRDQVIDVVGQVSDILPLWMTSKQANGRVLGFTRAAILAYCKPGKGNQLAYNIRTQWGERLNLIDFDVDRYILDRQYTQNWIPSDDSTPGGRWEPASATTFDLQQHYRLLTASPFVGGTGYAVGDRVRIQGSQIGGANIRNDVVIRVAQVTSSGSIQLAWVSGIAPPSELLEPGTIFMTVSGTNITGSGSGATFNIQVSAAGPTIFDDNSLLFNAPSDQYGLTDRYNKYLLFPKVNILYAAPEPPPPPPQLTGA